MMVWGEKASACELTALGRMVAPGGKAVMVWVMKTVETPPSTVMVLGTTVAEGVTVTVEVVGVPSWLLPGTCTTTGWGAL